ncbi:MAG: DUF4864 domain-containing protein [Paracoccaceae bacterium]
MRRALLAAVLIVAGALVALAQDARNLEIEGTIQGQIEAFLVDDFTAAFAFASPNIRRIFGSSENFGTMVRQGYPMVWRPADVRFLELRELGGRTLQRVMIQDRAGVFHVLEYQMLAGENGWQINGVRLVPQPDVGA